MAATRWMATSAVLAAVWMGCMPPHSALVPVGGTLHPPNPEGSEVAIFWGSEKPQRSYRVMGMLFVDRESDFVYEGITVSTAVEHMRRLAGEHGAQALIDVRMPDSTGVLAPVAEADSALAARRVQGKAIVFVEESD